MTEDQKIKRRENTKRWLAKPGNLEKHREAVRKCRQRPAAKERHRVRSAMRAAANRASERIRVAKWRAENPVSAVKSRRSYYLKNKTSICEKIKIYRLENKNKYLEYGRLRKAAKRASGGRLSKGKIKSLFLEQGGKCNGCKADLNAGYHLDHIVAIMRGGLHCDENVQLLCPTCNRRKSSLDFQEFLARLDLENSK